MPRALITTVPFGARDQMPFELLRDGGIDFTLNPFNKKLTEQQLIELIPEFDVLVAGTEPITSRVLHAGKNLKHISRVGIGLDNVNLSTAAKLGITVSYTPDAPAPAVAELTIGLMLSLLREIHVSNSELHQGVWNRIFGRRLANITLGIIGAGRIGSRVLNRTKAFGTPRILVNDVSPNLELDRHFKIEWSTKEKIYRESDLISLHVPLTHLTKNMVTKDHLLAMKPDAIIINTSRGGIINEQDLYEVLLSGHLSGAAVDVFESEPYDGPLSKIQRCILTAHMGSMSVDCRTRMEVEATSEVVRFFKGQQLKNPVPAEEFDLQRQNLK